jgi:glycosyltransferase involved in cell wall biosynthesis
MRIRAVSDPPPSLAGWIDRRRLVRVGINVEQLLARSPGGIGRYSAQLATLLARLAPTDDVVPYVARHRRAGVDRTLAAAGVDGVAQILALPRPVLYEMWVRTGHPRLDAAGAAPLDVVHAPSLAVPGRGRVPLVVTVHDAAAELWPDAFTARGRAFHRRGVRAAARRADLVIAVSAAAADELVACSSLRSEQIRVVHHAVVPPAADPAIDDAVLRRHGLRADGYVLWVGSLEPRKGVGTLVAAMARLHRGSRVAVPLVLAGFDGWLGGGPVDDADLATLGDGLVRLGPVDEDELWALYRGAAVFALPSRHEGFGLPVVEAMSQGTATVCSDLAALREVTGGAAALVAVGDVGAWADTLGGLLADPAARAELGRRGARRAARFDARTFVDATRAVYCEVTGG